MKPHSRRPIQLFRIASLVVPSALAWNEAFSAPHPTELTRAVVYALGPLWALVAGALLLRGFEALLAWRRAAEAKGAEPGAPDARPSKVEGPSLLDRIDVLTASGSALSWLGAGAVLASVWVGWASLSVVGLMGLVVFHLSVLWACIVAGGEDPLRIASLSRSFVPGSVVEGEPVIEQIRLAGVRIPIGFRLFAGGRIGPRWPTSRYTIDDAASGGEIVLESDVGPAVRGDHHAEPLELWLQDVFGLCRSARFRTGKASLRVLPRPQAVGATRRLLDEGGPDREPRPASRLPTEGSFRLREYQPGDEVRRIHWVRSLAAGQIVVRLPDELPPDQPSVRLVLDTYLPGADGLSCASPAQLLDALVAVWLGVGRALADSGVRVTLVTAAPLAGEPKDAEVVPCNQRLSPRALAAALHLGSRVRWQDKLHMQELVAGATGAPLPPAIIVACRLQPTPTEQGEQRWILVRGGAWARFDEPWPESAEAVLPEPMGSPDNRWSRRRRERQKRARALRDQIVFSNLCTNTAAPRAGVFLARPTGPSQIELEALS